MYNKQSTTRSRAYSMKHVTPLVPYMLIGFITLTSCWARWCLKSPASRLFALPFVRAQIKEKHQSSTSLAFCEGNPPVTYGFPSQRPSDAKMFPLDDVIMLLGKAILLESVHEFHMLEKSFSSLCIYDIHLCVFIANQRWSCWFKDTYVGDLVTTR